METQPNNLNTLKILFIVKAVLNLLAALFFAGYGFFVNMILTDVAHGPHDTPFDVTTFVGVISGVGFASFLILAILTFLAGKYLGETRNHTFILVVSILNFFTGILGILLGIFTLIEINKPHVKPMFETK
ncbi:hypothetical protein [Leeuwenhoekiella nanhaiensis]|uniref:DUF4064 domain-containing protein n=1 Tax=Leeuwenhoekiella nanhaiensis TaxID=1655491 RepID=A0A2G1VVP1_9FLAO|nr:hypothetical protein [Leeuwenhoekiella nanhaiensis]PHQ30680.1 hypothetical protein CJ305_00150 [Leeuwenhoekiella nanhaiensis]